MDWLKKNLPYSLENNRMMVNSISSMSVRMQGEPLAVRLEPWQLLLPAKGRAPGKPEIHADHRRAISAYLLLWLSQND